RDGEYESHLWRRPLGGGRGRQLTRGRVRDGSPEISPDGTRVAFIRSRVGEPDAVGQAWILPLDGGEPWPLTSLPHGVSGVRWSPDGRRLALVAQAGDQRFIVGEERKGRSPIARRITRLDYRDDESGHVTRRAQLWVVPVRPGATPRQLTSGDHDVIHPAWFPNGSRIAFAADRGPDTTIQPRLQLWSVGTEGSRPRIRELASLAGDADRPALSPDGRFLAFVGTDVADPPDDEAPQLWIVELPSGRPRSLTAGLDRPVGEWAWCDLVTAEDRSGPVWLDDGSLAILVGHRGRNIPYRVTVDGTAEPMLDPETRIAAAGIAAAGDAVVISAGLDGSAGELWTLAGGQLRRLTTEGSAWQRRFPGVEITELALDGPGGPIQAWVASPVGAGRRRLPTVLHVHGGPTGAWGPGGTMDAMALCGAGFRVVMPNIRGSATFGSSWVRELRRGWGSVDAEDAMATMDSMVERGLADADRLSVMGLSYGGFMTQWLIGVTDRFAAACSENGVANQVSAWGNSYFGVHYNRRAGLGDPLSDAGMRALWRSSPLRNASNVRTPLLMLQAEEDRICPPADNEQLFTALRVLDRTVEYVLYPDEHHEMRTSGRPDRRIDRMERILAWFRTHARRP
ncbi:MAG: prolyl oligopeptidase family serine peptidase, partial [Chloroflexi bacterium]|nr:prolyl oligopeptidase family serine peptidase [Chloroflexota bacterium]